MKIVIPCVIIALMICGCSNSDGPSSNFLNAKLHGWMERVGYKDLHMTVQQLVDYSSDENARRWIRQSATDWSLTLDLPDGDKLVMLMSAVPDLHGGVLLKSVKGKDINLEGFGVMTFTAMLQAKQNEAKH